VAFFVTSCLIDVFSSPLHHLLLILMKMRKAAAAFCCLFFLLLLGCHNEPQTVEQVVGKDEENTIHIGIAWVRGDGLLIEGAELAVAEANASGGVLQKKIKLIINQNESGTSDILEHTSSLMAGENIKEYSRQTARYFIRHSSPVTAVIGHRYSFMALSAAGLYQQSRMLFIAPTATNDLLTSMDFDYVFRMLPKNSVLGRQLALYSAARGIKRVAIFNERSEYALELSSALKQSLAGQGVRTVVEYSFFSGMSGREFTSYAVEFKRHHKREPVDAVFLLVSGDMARSIIREFYKRGVGDTLFLTGEGVDEHGFWLAMQGLQEDVKGQIHVGVPTLFQAESNQTRFFRKKFIQTYEEPPDSLAALGYDSVNILLAAIEQAEAAAPDKVVDELRYLRACQGLTQKIAFEDNGDIVYKPYMIKWMTATGFEYRDLKNHIVAPDAQLSELPGCVNIDRDKDGIVDKRDVCPDNRKEELVQGVFLEGEQLGCPIDIDDDDVPDYRDKCPGNTSEELDEGVNAEGCPVDSDQDQVPDYRDTCPQDTPEQLSKGVTARGCPLDTDEDGVADYADVCPNNPPEESKEGVNLIGCPVDRDKDGVPDYWDKCLDNTAEELRFGVRRNGCPQNSDNDQYPDYQDLCRLDSGADLAQGTDEHGCPKDSDEDGVYDVYDACPNTVQGRRVNEQGCALVTLFSENIFASAGSIVSAQGERKLRTFIQTLTLDNIERITIIAHADGQGTAAFNIRLSQERADSVARFFRQEGIPQSVIDAQGVGESQPVADDTTEEGRRKNRRVELSVRLKAKVKAKERP
jgi:ABC-type branched-subunit amino acid transport system substrate-binding protein/outer membrane protein OmpA-like peptidoglycan-associated protein